MVLRLQESSNDDATSTEEPSTLVADTDSLPPENATASLLGESPPLVIKSVEEHDAAVMNRLMRPFQIGDLLQTVMGRSILVFVAFGFLLQLFGYSYIVEFDTVSPPTDGSSTAVSGPPKRTGPPKFRIGTIEERQFLEEIRRDMKQQSE
jgi:hypothetical protein